MFDIWKMRADSNWRFCSRRYSTNSLFDLTHGRFSGLRQTTTGLLIHHQKLNTVSGRPFPLLFSLCRMRQCGEGFVIVHLCNRPAKAYSNDSVSRAYICWDTTLSLFPEMKTSNPLESVNARPLLPPRIECFWNGGSEPVKSVEVCKVGEFGITPCL